MNDLFVVKAKVGKGFADNVRVFWELALDSDGHNLEPSCPEASL